MIITLGHLFDLYLAGIMTGVICTCWYVWWRKRK